MLIVTYSHSYTTGHPVKVIYASCSKAVPWRSRRKRWSRSERNRERYGRIQRWRKVNIFFIVLMRLYILLFFRNLRCCLHAQNIKMDSQQPTSNWLKLRGDHKRDWNCFTWHLHCTLHSLIKVVHSLSYYNLHYRRNPNTLCRPQLIRNVVGKDWMAESESLSIFLHKTVTGLSLC